MTLIKSISGIRGTIGGPAGSGLTPPDIVKFTSAFASWAVNRTGIKKIVIGRDARLSGTMVSHLVTGTLQGMGINVVDLGLSTTPTVEIAVPLEEAAGGIIITASHNPAQWNALKLVNELGEFINDFDGKEVLQLVEAGDYNYAEVTQLGTVEVNDSYLQKHIQMILDMELVDVAAIKAANFKVVVDGVNSSGGIFVPALLNALGVNNIVELYCTPDGRFPHDPEPLPENLTEIARVVKAHQADLGIVVDPDVDRLCFVCEDGSMFGEEYTLVAVADYVLQHHKGNTVSNLSSTRALRDVTESHGGEYNAAAVGEVNVVTRMKETNALIGGEGNGGIIYPVLHYGRDALVGIALFLSHLAKCGKQLSDLKRTYPAYHISKNKIELEEGTNIDALMSEIQLQFKDQPHSVIDGLKIEFDKEWVHLRRSNTEPVIRIYAESTDENKADLLAQKIISLIKELLSRATI
jgi:phosphomannomutase